MAKSIHKYSFASKGSSELNDLCSGGILQVNDKGRLESKPLTSKEKVQNIEKWTDAFVIYMIIYLQKHANKASELLQYMSTIREAGSRGVGFGWRTYDEQFRMRQSLDLKTWGTLNSDLWLRIMTPSLTNASSSFDTQQRKQSTGQFQSLCKDYNKGFCTWPNCRFKHCCQLCGSFEHGMMRCQSTVRRGSFARHRAPVGS